MARDTLTGPVPVDVGAVHKGKGKGKGKKGKGKGKDKNKEKDEREPATYLAAEIVCSYCHWKGHRNRDCKTFEKDKDNIGVNAVEQAPGLTPGAVAASVTPS